MMRGALNFALVLFFATCIFDPADRLLGLKVPLFIACWLIALASCALSRKKCYIHIDLVRYTLLFLLVPVLSVASYWASDGGEPFEGFQLLKGYLLVTLGALLFIQRIDALPHLAALLTVLAVAIIGVFVTLMVEPGLATPLRLFGNATGMLYLDSRDYGSGLVLSQVYFATSPMLVVSVAYYYHLARVSSVTKRKLAYYTAAAVSIVAMPLAGSRNNIAIAVFLPLTLSVVYGKNRVASGIAALAFALCLVIIFFDEIAVLLNPLEFSNNLKLALLDDYANLLSHPSVLLFGKGLGSYDYWTPRGSEYFVTELTYLELFRTFGVFGALLILALLLFPLLYAFLIRPSFTQGHIVIAYGFYLVMAVSNPTLFSSLGILILAIILANMFLFEDRVRSGTRFPARHPLVVARP